MAVARHMNDVEKVLVMGGKILIPGVHCRVDWPAVTQTPIPVILVTGAGRGLGRGIAVHLASEGCSVAINFAGNRGAAEEAAGLCRKASRSGDQKFPLIQADIGSPSDRGRLVAETLSTLGRIDALVNNAGIAPRVRADLTHATEESFGELIRVNLQGPYFLTQAVARHWLENKPQPALPTGHYCVSKAGLAMAVQLWAARLAAHNIQVVEVRPGIMATDMTAGAKAKYDLLMAGGLVPQGRWGTPEDVGLAVRSIIAGQLPFSTGSVIAVDGGFHIRRL
jgi:NAD(P)-dependent dehydrogenase (short-subunit alcohol dehydrogenase family)